MAAIVVVTALERAGSDGGDQPSVTSVSTVTTVAAPQPVQATTIPATSIPATSAAGNAPAPAAERAAALAAEPVVDLRTDTAVVGPTSAAVEGTIQISLVHGGASSPAIDSIPGMLLGPLKVDVLDATGASIASVEVPVDQVGRIEGLVAGSYRLVLSQQTPVSTPSPGVAISAASSQITQSIVVADGDVLLIAAQRA